LNLGVGAYREYLPIEGLAAFNKVATVQGLSGTGSLRQALYDSISSK
uniref:Aspartate aminotransferase 1 (Fragments) n=1 Tax=Pseudotsuga menziesii TaxID=3357 RepID=AAT1_PSEMZ|nr:RecName: Full=Aspartate aminotransferase 1; AltName: Full=Transaminase A [Pseudotsuga menziesii]